MISIEGVLCYSTFYFYFIFSYDFLLRDSCSPWNRNQRFKFQISLSPNNVKANNDKKLLIISAVL